MITTVLQPSSKKTEALTIQQHGEKNEHNRQHKRKRITDVEQGHLEQNRLLQPKEPSL
jgi:hypothetical protein